MRINKRVYLVYIMRGTIHVVILYYNILSVYNTLSTTRYNVYKIFMPNPQRIH